MTTISAGDAEVALRTFPRRWRSLLGGFEPGDPDVEAILSHPGPGGRSAMGCATRAGEVLEEARRAVQSAVGLGGAPTAGTPVSDELGAALTRIDVAAPALADVVRDLAAGDLDAAAGAGSVRSLVSDAVTEMADLLREAGEALRSGRAATR